MLKNQKGITLIALVITIIVLLILAGVSIAMLTGDNGILSQSNNAKYQTKQAEAVEKINLVLNAVKTEVYSQRVSDADWDPIITSGSEPDITTTLQTAISGVLSKDEFTSITGTPSAEQKYYYKLSGTTLTVGYQSKSEANLNNAITGSIDLNATAETFLDLTPAKLPTT